MNKHFIQVTNGLVPVAVLLLLVVALVAGPALFKQTGLRKAIEMANKITLNLQ